jgi:DNA-binding PadR family transcriptional regulator
MEILSKTEEMILLAVCKLRDNAYGVTIRRYLQDITGNKISIGGIYVPLDRLVRKCYLEAWQSDPTPARGGMSKRYFRLTSLGHKALAEAKDVHEKLWSAIPDLKLTQN